MYRCISILLTRKGDLIRIGYDNLVEPSHGTFFSYMVSVKDNIYESSSKAILEVSFCFG